jgi:hypothetical protein
MLAGGGANVDFQQSSEGKKELRVHGALVPILGSQSLVRRVHVPLTQIRGGTDLCSDAARRAGLLPIYG